LVALAGLLALLGALPASTRAAEPPVATPLRQTVPRDPFDGLAQRFRNLAKRDEAGKDWHRALIRWEAVSVLAPRDRQARQRISAIQRLLKDNGERHFALARDAFRHKQYAKAFREFLRTLSYDPDNHLALEMVKHELNAKSVNEYTVKRGDTLREIAQSQYDDPDLTYLVRYYNNIRNPRDLKVGAVLRLPVVAGVDMAQPPAPKAVVAPTPAPPKASPPPTRKARKAPPSAVAKAKPEPKHAAPAAPVAGTQPARAASPPALRTAAAVQAPQSAGTAIVESEVRQASPSGGDYGAPKAGSQLAEARRLLKAKQYEQAAAAAEALLEDDPANGDAHELQNAAYYEEGKQLSDRKKPVAALQVLSRVDPGYKDTAALLTSLKGQLKGSDAEVHYIAGVTAFLQEDLDTAISEWQETLKLDPSHPQAAKDLANAQALRAKLASVK